MVEQSNLMPGSGYASGSINNAVLLLMTSHNFTARLFLFSILFTKICYNICLCCGGISTMYKQWTGLVKW